MEDPETTRGATGLTLSAYEAKLVVAALCRYARAGDVHDAHRDRCEHLAGALAEGGSVTVASVVGEGRESADGPGEGRVDDAGRAPATAGGRTAARDRTTADGDPAAAAGVAARDAGAETAFRWGPDRADG